MIQLNNVVLRRGSKLLLDSADLALFDQQKVGIVGANGAGKSSLFQCLLGQLSCDEGEIDIPKKLYIAHLKQETPAANESALDYALQGDHQYSEVKLKMEEIEESGDGMAIAEIHSRFAEIDGYSAPSRAAIILHGLGFSEEQLSWPVKDFSGGWRMRLNLAQVLLSRAEMMLLDEPTNHLDLEGIIWLSDWIKQAKCLVIIISHDREFLDDICSHIVHVKNKKLKRYTGNYSYFEQEYARQLLVQQAAHDKQQAHIAHLQKFVDRFGAKASKAKQAQSRVKMIERIDRVAAVRKESPFHFEFADNVCGINPMLTMDDISVGYGDKQVLNELDFALSDGDRIGLLGLNGAGKSTLIKLLAGELNVSDGKVERSNKIKVGYFAQHQLELLSADESILWHFQNLDSRITDAQARTFLGGFNFLGNEVFNKINTMSGGEKARLVLALLVWQKPNLLLMDEPTNHLDIDMREALMLALQNFQGAMVLVSHDRYLLNCLVDEFWLVDAGQARLFDGDLNDYHRWLKDREDQLCKVKKPHDKVEKVVKQKTAPAKTINHKQLEKQIHALEKNMAKLNGRLKHLENKLGDNNVYLPMQASKLAELQESDKILRAEVADIEEQLIELYEQTT